MFSETSPSKAFVTTETSHIKSSRINSYYIRTSIYLIQINVISFMLSKTLCISDILTNCHIDMIVSGNSITLLHQYLTGFCKTFRRRDENWRRSEIWLSVNSIWTFKNVEIYFKIEEVSLNSLKDVNKGGKQSNVPKV